MKFYSWLAKCSRIFNCPASLTFFNNEAPIADEPIPASQAKMMLSILARVEFWDGNIQLMINKYP